MRDNLAFIACAILIIIGAISIILYNIKYII